MAEPLPALEGHVVLVGDDGLGVRVLQELIGLDVPVCAVCPDPQADLAAAARAASAPLVVGDPTHADVLRAAQVERARSCGLLCDADVPNLHGSLVLQEVAPAVRVVLRLPNASVGESLRDLLGESVVLSPTDLVVPAFIEAALRASAGPVLSVGEERLAVREVPGDDPRLRLALAEAGVADEPRLFPTDAATVVGLVREDATQEGLPIPAVGAAAAMMTGPEGHGAPRAVRTAGRVLAVMLDRRLLVVGALLTGFVFASALAFVDALGVDLLDALYFTVTTITTTGYGDINLLDAPASTKAFGMIVMIIGSLVVAVVFALVTDVIVGARLAQALGEFPVPRRDHVVVCGAGLIGSRVLEDLAAAKVPCVAVERDEDVVDRTLLKRLRVPVIIGDAGTDETLASTHLPEARALMAVTNDDVANLQCALLARTLAPSLRVVLRLSDPDLAARVERAVGIHLSRSPFALAAPAFTAALLGHPSAAVVPVGRDVMQIASLTPAAPVTVGELDAAGEARVVAVAGAAFPPPELEVPVGAELVAVGTNRGLAGLQRRLQHALPAPRGAAPTGGRT